MNRELEKLEDEGSISNFKSEIKRVHKNRYKMELELYLTDDQVRNGVSNLIEKLTILEGGD